MSHFSVLVATKEYPTESVLEPIMAPWHEFECTGIDDQYVINVDCLGRLHEEYSTGIMERFNVDGEMIPVWKIPEEDRGKYELAKVPISELYTEEEYLMEYFGATLCTGEPNTEGPHKYGWYKKDADGRVTEYIDRTNPNSKWDYWVIGGRWRDSLLSSKIGAWTSILKKKYLDIQGMEQVEKDRRIAHIDKALEGLSIQNGVTKEELLKAHAEAVLKHEPDSDEFKKAKDYGLYSWENGLCSPVVCSALLSEPDPYAWANSDIGPVAYAVVHDGRWESEGDMGWWGISSNEKSTWSQDIKDIIAKIPDEYWLTIVDCHI